MIYVNFLINFIFLKFILATSQINPYYTDWFSDNESINVLQHDCFRVPAYMNENNRINRELLTYCMSESLTKYHIEVNNLFQKFTFAELAKQNITSHQLYIWSAPIDIAERYQFYLNQISASNTSNHSSDKDTFYNCTFPRFGLSCQYQINIFNENYTSLYNMIINYYESKSTLTNIICYTHLECNRGPFPACLDWKEICDGQIDCMDNKIDEEHCLDIEIHVCNDNEFRCTNGQCIPISFLNDDGDISDCADRSDEFMKEMKVGIHFQNKPPLFQNEEQKSLSIPLGNVDLPRRSSLLFTAIFLVKDNSTSNQCWSALRSTIGVLGIEIPFFNKTCMEQECYEIIDKSCPDMFFYPDAPLFFHDIRLAFNKTDIVSQKMRDYRSAYICYNSSYYGDYSPLGNKFLFKNATCYYPGYMVPFLLPSLTLEDFYLQPLYTVIGTMKVHYLIYNYTNEICNRSNMYQCINSLKCISMDHLLDAIIDCPKEDDENITHIIDSRWTNTYKNLFKCEINNLYIHQLLVKDGRCQCLVDDTASWCEDEDEDYAIARKKLLFQTVCNGPNDLIPINIDGQNRTDETECERWPCNNIYTRCDSIWQCSKGEDEIGCYSFSTLNCSSRHHLCVSFNTNQLECLPYDKVNDNNIDCVGGTDEPTICRKQVFAHETNNDIFACKNSSSNICFSSSSLCNSYFECQYGDDELFCTTDRNISRNRALCWTEDMTRLSQVERFLCETFITKKNPVLKYFSLHGSTESNSRLQKDNVAISSSNRIGQDNSLRIIQENPCNRGIQLIVWIDEKKKLSRTTCICPPSYYGDHCQYQNQRVSLTIQCQTLSDSWSTLFTIIISLIDHSEQRIIHSYEQLTYLSVRDCKIKFNIYLLYSNRPKSQIQNYSIHIDVYEKVSLDYRASFLYPIKFLFLPVHRQALIIIIPGLKETIKSCSNLKCIHGKCMIYSYSQGNATFCQCDPGWSGQYCTIKYDCKCSSDSKCIDLSAHNRSICICPINKFGYRCLLTDPICQRNDNSTCLNGGYIGERCEIPEKKIIISFDKNLVVSQLIFIHFLEVIKDITPKRSTTLKMMIVRQNSLTIYWSQIFHMIFIEFENKIYYLAAIEQIYNLSMTLVTTIKSSDRCQHINELFNKTFVQMHIIRRIKYYHLPCQQYSLNLSCFYDDIYFCYCYNLGKQRLANCFEFNHTMKFDCYGKSVCENGGQCFQDSPTCPTRSICVCQSCFYGARCQFSTNGFGLSLDAIIGYYIQPNTNIFHQSMIVKVSLVLTIIFMMIGYTNGILSIMTFKDKTICQVGCGLYLLDSSITTLLTTTMFGFKFWILLLAQMKIITNRSFLNIQCLSVDFLLQVFLNMDQWLNACVAVERAITIIKATNFQKKKSKQMAKLIIIILSIFIISTCIYDPIHRRLIDDKNEDDNRIWCIASYTSNLQKFNSFIHTFHFLIPLTINLVSVVILILKKSRQQARFQINQNYLAIIKKQIQEHKHIIIAPIVLVILGIPRLIIPFLSKCMNSTDDATLYLTGYFISFISPMLTFIIFVLPSKFYKEKLGHTFVHIKTKLQQILTGFSTKVKS
ncbi:unnamed protein product [Rotaria sp. Silwood2]|nr:unnamed protein product [Rotaria sp. Silwood2]